jgi:glycosyltransferase involved in cell wall biosynthesis
MHPQKAVDWLISVAPQFLEQLPAHDLVLIGEGPQRAELTALARRLGLSQRIHFLGWRPDVRALMTTAELLLLPSRWEGMPNVMLEAMASSKPVVATRVAGVVELLGATAEQQTVEPGDGSALAEKVIQISRDKRSAAELGQANFRRVAEHFSLRQMVDAYGRLYRELTP